MMRENFKVVGNGSKRNNKMKKKRKKDRKEKAQMKQEYVNRETPEK
jgi:hypothetical protein